MYSLDYFVPYYLVICILEASGKWPEEADAVKRLKAAFHIKLGEILEKKYKLTNSVFPTHVDVLKVSSPCGNLNAVSAVVSR